MSRVSCLIQTLSTASVTHGMILSFASHHFCYVTSFPFWILKLYEMPLLHPTEEWEHFLAYCFWSLSYV